MNKTQVNNFLKCLQLIDDVSYLSLHKQSTEISLRSSNNSHYHNQAVPVRPELRYVADDHDHDHDHDHEHEHEHDHEHEHSSSHDLLVAKVTAMVVLFCASALCGYVPFLLNRCFKWTEKEGNARSALVVKCLLYFGAGVLLCTTFLHLLPEVNASVERLNECGILTALTFPLAELLMCAGFFLMFFIEELMHACLHRHTREGEASAAFERGHSVRNSYLVKGGDAETPDKTVASRTLQFPDDNNCEKGSMESSGSEPQNGATTLSIQDLIATDGETQNYNKQIDSGKDHYHCPHYHHHHHHQHHHHSHQHDHQHHVHEHDMKHHGHSHIPQIDKDDIIASSLRGLFIVLALSLHELFEGMAIGLEGSASSVWFMFGAVSAHKLVLAFCVGVELIVARTRLALSIVYILTFAIVSPIGISIGILISSHDDAAQPGLAAPLLQGLACGTLLYVVFFEILSKNHGGLGSYLALIVGFLVMFGLQQITSVGHGHSHGGNCGESSEVSETSGMVTTHSAKYNADEMAFERQLQLLRQASYETLQRT